MVTFASRVDAGRQLVQFLRDEQVAVDLVLGLPRGGVVVAAEIAHALHKPLDTLIVRKIGHPTNREFAVGALAESEVVLLDHASLLRFPASQWELEQIIAEETERLREYQAHFHPNAREQLANKAVLLVDDGIATGTTAEAAVLSARRQLAQSVTMTAPVASSGAIKRLRRHADDVKVLHVDPQFNAVGQYYDEFPQTSDEEVIALLRAAGKS